MIQNLPAELIEHICDEIRVHRDLLALALCCRILHTLIAENRLIYRRVHTGMDADNVRLRPVWQHFIENPVHARRVSDLQLNGRSDTRDFHVIKRLVENTPGITRIARGQHRDFFLLAVQSMSALTSFALDSPYHLGATRTNELWRILGASCPQLYRFRIMQISTEFTEDLPHIQGLRSVYIRFNRIGPHVWEGRPHTRLVQFMLSQTGLERLSLESLSGEESLAHDLLWSTRWPRLAHLRLRINFRDVSKYYVKEFIVAHGSTLQVLEYPTDRLRPLPEGSLPVLHTLILGDHTDQNLIHISHACPPCLVEIRGLSGRRQITGGRAKYRYKREGLASVRKVYTRTLGRQSELEPFLVEIIRAFDQEIEVYVPDESHETGWRRFTTNELLNMEAPINSESD